MSPEDPNPDSTIKTVKIESLESVELSRENVIAGLKAVLERSVSDTERALTPEFEILQKYIEFHEAELNAQTQDPVAGAFHRLDFTLNLARMYKEAGYEVEARDTIIPAMGAVLTHVEIETLAGSECAVDFEDLYKDMHNFFFNVDPSQGPGSVVGGPDEHWSEEV